MTMTDDAVVRELTARADREAPAMSLDPTAVLAAGRHRRRRAQLRLSAVAAVVITGAALVPTLNQHQARPAGTESVELVPGLTATIVAHPTTVDTSEGPALDLGVLAPRSERWHLGISDEGSDVALRRYDPESGVLGDALVALGTPGTGSSQTITDDDGTMTVLGLVSPADTVTLTVVLAGGRQRAIDVPTFAVPGGATAYVVLFSGRPAGGDWPDAAFSVASSPHAGTSATSTTPLSFRPLVPADAADGDSLTVEVAAASHAVDTPQGPGVDTGVLAPRPPIAVNGLSPDAPPSSYVVRASEEASGATYVWLETYSGADTISDVAFDLTQWQADGNGDPIPGAVVQDHWAALLGVLPPDARQAALLVERSTGTERYPMPTFRALGADADLFFALVTDEGLQPAGWPSVRIEVTDAYGAVTLWTLDGAEVTDATP